MEVLVERDQVPPAWIALEQLLLPEDRPPPLPVAEEDAREPPRQLGQGSSSNDSMRLCPSG